MPKLPETQRTLQELVSAARVHRRAGRFDKARRSLQGVLDTAPTHADALFELGELTVDAGSPGKAVPYFAAALKNAADNPAYWGGLVRVLIAADRLAEARTIVERFRSGDFDASQIRLALDDSSKLALREAQKLFNIGRPILAETFVDIAILIDDADHAAAHLAGLIALNTDRTDLAFELVSIAIYRDGTKGRYFASLGRILHTRTDLQGARSAFERAIELDPDCASSHAEIAGLLHRCGDYKQAFHHARQAVALDPKLPDGHGQMATALMLSGQIQNAVAAFDRVIRLDPENISARSNRLYTKLYSEHIKPEDYAAEARAFGHRFTSHLRRKRPFPNTTGIERPLRVGFVSGDFYDHPVARFFEPFLVNADREKFEFVAFMTYTHEDEQSNKLRSKFSRWHNIARMNDDAAADLIEAERIDILVDLSGHTAGHRLLVFGRKPAPVQVTWIGLPATTGLTAIDYRLTDAVHDPENATGTFHTETLWRLPRIQASYLAPTTVPDVCQHAPFEANGYVTFGSLNRYSKISDGTLQAWARILAFTDRSRLAMVVAGVEDSARKNEIELRLKSAGVPLDRVDLHPQVPKLDYYEFYSKIDIALDTFPYNGGTTSCDSLWMGVPFISLIGKHAVARTGLAVLTAVDLEDLAATTTDGYIAKAQNLANDPDRLRALRLGLREKVAASPLVDHQGLADAVADSFRAMWHRWSEATVATDRKASR